jgi:iron(III) transport system permease protein
VDVTSTIHEAKWLSFSGRGLQALVALVCVILVLTPLVPLLIQSFIDRPLYDAGWDLSFAGYHLLFTSPEAARVVGNTLYFSVISASLSLFIGIAAAIVIGRTDMPFAGFVGSVSLWPFYISPIVLAVGWAIVYGPSGYVSMLARSAGLPAWNLYSLEGMALVSAISHAPVTFLYAIGSVHQQDSSLEDAALMSGAGPFRIISRITLPLMKPALTFCVIMNVVTALEAFAIPLVLGGPVGLDLITSFIYRAGFSAVSPNYPLVAAAAVCLLLIISCLTFLQLFLLRKAFRFTTVGGKATRQRAFELGPMRWLILLPFAVYIALGILVPIAGVFARSFTSFLSPAVSVTQTFTLANFQAIFSQTSYVNALWNTLAVALFGGALSTIVIAMIVFVAHRSDFPARRVLDFLAQYPRAVPGILVGLGLFYVAALLPFFAELRNTLWILVIAYTMRFLPSGYSVIAPAVIQLSDDFDRAARTMGASWLSICWRIIVPLAKGSIVACYSILFVLFVKEYASAVFLYTPGTEVIGTVMLSFWSQGDSGPVAALAVLQILVVAVFVLLSRKLFGARFHG